MPRHPGGGHARRGTSRQRAHKPRLRAPHRRIPPLLMLPQHIYYSTFRPKRKGFSFIIIVFCFGRGENVVFGQSGCVRFCRETVQAAWECTAKVSKGRSQSRQTGSVLWSCPQARNPASAEAKSPLAPSAEGAVMRVCAHDGGYSPATTYIIVVLFPPPRLQSRKVSFLTLRKLLQCLDKARRLVFNLNVMLPRRMKEKGGRACP